MDDKTWFSVAELAGMPGMPSSKRRTKDKVERLAKPTQVRQRQNRGGGKEYHISSLPPETQAHLRHQVEPEQHHSQPENVGDVDYPERPKTENRETVNGNRQLPIPNTQYPTPVTPHLSPVSIPTETFIAPASIPASKPKKMRASQTNEEDRINAKVEILRTLECFCQENNLPKINCQHVFAYKYSQGEISVSESTRKAIPNLCQRTLQRWMKNLESGSVQALGGRYGHRAGDTKIDAMPKVRDFILGLITQYPHASGRQILMALQGTFEREILPSLRTVERWINGWKQENQELFTATANPDAWKNKYMTAFGSYSDGIVRLNQLWEMDSTPADVMLEGGRYHLIGCIDVYSRRLKLLVVPTSKSVHIGTLLRECLLDWGVPEMVKTDNGKDYTANYLQRLFLGLNIQQKLCPPFQPWHKPHIERSFRTFSHDLLEMVEGYTGHDVAERQELRARTSFSDRLMTKNQEVIIKMSPIEFQTFCNNWTDTLYANRPHDGLQNRTPFQVFTEWRGSIKRIADERALDILLAEAPGSNGLRVVQKRGIQLEGTYFIAPELEAWVGKTVQVRFDPLDMGKIYVFDGDFQLICIAEDPARTGINRQEVASRARQMQQQRVSEGRRALKRLKNNIKTADVVEAIIQDAEDKTANVIPFPLKAEEYETAALQTAMDVIEASKPKKYATMSAEELAEADAAMERLERKPEIIRDGDDFCRLWREVKSGKGISGDDKQWMKHYITTPEGKGTLRFLEVSEEQIRSLA